MFANSLRAAFIEEREATALATTRIEETLASIRTVKAFGTEAGEADHYARENWDAFLAGPPSAPDARALPRHDQYCSRSRLRRRDVRRRDGSDGRRHERVSAHVAVSLGLFQGSIALVSRVSARTRNITDQWGSMQDVVVAISRVLEMLGQAPEHSVSSGHAIPPKSAAALRFDGVNFAYDPRSPVLAGVSLEARAGEITAIAGPSGSGKSTIISLIVRFFDPTAGSILLDAEPIAEFELHGVARDALGGAAGESALHRKHSRQRRVRPPERINGRSRRSDPPRRPRSNSLHSLPAGLDTMLGEKGSKLSVGQAQRIGLARALLRNAPILLLDEPTSALDVATEEAVMIGLREWVNEEPKRRMVILATHRAHDRVARGPSLSSCRRPARCR